MSSFYSDKKNKNDNIRIIKRNLVYMIGIDPKIAHKDILIRREYLGQYGKITKILVNSGKVYNPTNSTQGPSYSAYINYSLEQEAALAILSIDSSIYNGKQIKAAFGTTKYCAFYMKKIPCPNKECVYVHSIQDKSNIISKESSDFYIEQHKIAIKVSDIGNNKVREMLYNNRTEETIFPNPYSVYFKKNIVTQLKLDCGFEKSNSYISNRDNHHISHSNYQSSVRGGYTNSSSSRCYNNAIKSNQNVSYYENDLTNNKNNNEEIRVTKTIIKEINYDNPKEIEQDNNFDTEKRKSMSLSKMLSNNESPIDQYSNDHTTSDKELANIDKSEGSNDIEDVFNSISQKLDYNRSISKSRESSIKNDVYSNNIESRSFNTINFINTKDNNATIFEVKENNIIDTKYKNNSNESYLYNTNQEDTSSNNHYLSLNKHYSLFKLASKSKFEFVNIKPENYELSKSHSSKVDINSNNLGTEEITDSENQSKFLQQYYLRFTFSNLVKEECKVSIEQDYFQKLKKSICS